MTFIRLRHSLDDIDSKTLEDARTHTNRVAQLRSVFHHTIIPIPDESDIGVRDCSMFALGLPPSVANTVFRDPSSIYKEFIDHLIQMLSPASDINCEDGVLVFYFLKSKCKHVGNFRNCRVKSKWGKNPIYEHGALEVPASYGDELKYFDRPSSVQVFEEFISFVKQHRRYCYVKNEFEKAVKEYMESHGVE